MPPRQPKPPSIDAFYHTLTPWGEWESRPEKLNRLKQEKEEDEEFSKQLLIQFNRRVRDNPHINYSGDSFGGSPRKGLKQKVEDLLKDPHYPEGEFNRLKEQTMMVQNEKHDLRNQLWILKEVDLPRCQEEMKKPKEKLEKAEKELKELRHLNSIKEDPEILATIHQKAKKNCNISGRFQTNSRLNSPHL